MVQSALPVIDTSPPAYRGHVVTKLKKKQIENERCGKIEKDNYLLLQKMDHIMKTSRIDNSWKPPQPIFFSKISMYNSVMPHIEDIVFDYEESESIPKSRKSKCYACTPQKKKEMKVPEERIPWEPIKLPSRIRSKSVPVRKLKSYPMTKEDLPSSSTKPFICKFFNRSQTNTRSDMKTANINMPIINQPQSITLTRGSLKLFVNFPTDTQVKYQIGNVEKLLANGSCHCRNSNITVV